MNTVFLRALEASDKAAVLLDAICNRNHALGTHRFEVDAARFAEVPRSPFAYWISDRVRGLFTTLPQFESGQQTVKQGLATTDDFRFVRAWWEIPPMEMGTRWFSFAKGGAFAPFYADISLCMDWLKDGAQSWAIYEARRDVVGGIMKNPDFYFRPGLTYPRRLHRFAVMPLPAGSIISVRGSGIYADPSDLYRVAGLMSSSSFDFLVKCMLGRFGHPQFDNGTLCRTPVPSHFPASAACLDEPTRRAIAIKRALDTGIETSHLFVLPRLLQVSGATLADRAIQVRTRVTASDSELEAIQRTIDDACLDLYGLSGADRLAVSEGFGIDELADDEDAAPDEEDVNSGAGSTSDCANTLEMAADLLAWAGGVAFGRFDVRLAIGARTLPTLGEPFARLPACSPSMLTGNNLLPLMSPPSGYPLTFPSTGVLVDDPGHSNDLPTLVQQVFELCFGSDGDRWLSEVCEALGYSQRGVREWLADAYFDHHLARHSGGRRKAPIYWQLATPSGRYSVWLYAHRLTRDSLFQLQNDVVGPKVAQEERKLTSLIQNARGSPSASERKEIATQEAFVAELRGMLDEVKRVAPLWNPNLDDGVVLTMAPLWRLVPHHRTWQKELKARWDELAAGKFDWSHVAMHLWPERVVPKCATDRSLAIAHGLEDGFWVEGSNGKWKPRTKQTTPIAELVRERSSPAVKAALRALSDASAISGTGRARGLRVSRSGGSMEGSK